MSALEIETAGLTDAGRRPVNEDGLLIRPELGLVFVCDAMGGPPGGPLAAATACRVAGMLAEQNRAILESLNAGTSDDPGPAVDAVAAMVETVGRQVHLTLMARHDRQAACTAAMLVLTGRYAITAHVGDCRVYLVRDGVASAMTEDHVSTRRPDAQPGTPQRVLTRVLGLQPTVEVDTLLMELMPRDVLLCCTDGIASQFREAELADCCAKVPLADIPKNLMRVALSRSGRDNATVAAVKVNRVRMNSIDPAQQIKALRLIPLFAPLSYRELVKVCEVAQLVDYPAGQTIIRQGETGTDLYILLKGEAMVVKLGSRLAMLEKGSLFGEGNLLEPTERAADVLAQTDVSVLVIRRSDLLDMFKQQPAIGMKILWELSLVLNQRLRKTSTELSWAKGGM